MRQPFEEILNDCLERLAQGESIQRCLEMYPDHVQDLAPLLQVARVTMDAASASAPRPEFKARAFYRLSQLASEHRGHIRRLPTWIPALTRPLALVAVVALLIGGTITGLVTASANSVPGEPLYVVKRAKEEVEVRITRSEISRAQVYARLADTRMNEMRRLIMQEEMDRANVLAPIIRDHLHRAATLVGVSMTPDLKQAPFHPVPFKPMTPRYREGMRDLRHRLRQDMKAHRTITQDMLRRIPSQHRPSFEGLLRQSRYDYSITLEALTEQDTSLQPLD